MKFNCNFNEKWSRIRIINNKNQCVLKTGPFISERCFIGGWKFRLISFHVFYLLKNLYYGYGIRKLHTFIHYFCKEGSFGKWSSQKCTLGSQLLVHESLIFLYKKEGMGSFLRKYTIFKLCLV